MLVVACNPAPDPRQTKFRVQRDNVTAQYDEKTGRLKRLAVDTNKNGKPDAWATMDAARIERIEIDRNEDGIIDRWEYYADGKLVRVGTSTRGDGVEDEWAYPTADGTIARVETDTNRDGRVDKWDIYEPSPVPGAKSYLHIVALDPGGSGRPTRRLFYRPDGSFERQEIIR